MLFKKIYTIKDRACRSVMMNTLNDKKEGLTMSLIQMLLLLVFGVPMVVACLAFTLCAMWMQMREDQLRSEKQGLAECV